MLRLFLLLAASGAFLKTYAPSESSGLGAKPHESETTTYDPFAFLKAVETDSDNDLSGSRNSPPKCGSNPFDQFNQTTDESSYYLLQDNTSANLAKLRHILEINDQTPLLEIVAFLGNTRTETISLKKTGAAILEYSESKDLYYCTLQQSITPEVITKIAQHHRSHNRFSNPKICVFAQNAQNISPYAYFFEIQQQQDESQPKLLIEKTLTYTAPTTVPSSTKEFDSYLTRQLSTNFTIENNNPRALFEDNLELYETTSSNTSNAADTGMDSVNIFQLTALTKFAHAKHAPWVELFDDLPSSSIIKVNDKVFFDAKLNMYFAMFSKSKDQQLSPTMKAILEHAKSRKQAQENINILASFSFSTGQSIYTSYLARFFQLKPTKSGSYDLKTYNIVTSLNRSPTTKEESYIEEKIKDILTKTGKRISNAENIVSSYGLYKQFTQYMDESATGGTLGMQDIQAAVIATSRFLSEETIAPWHRMLAMFKFGSFEKNEILYKTYGKTAIAVAETAADAKTIEQTIENARKILDKGQSRVHLFLLLKNGEYVSPRVYHLEISSENIKERKLISTKINPSATTSQEAKISEAYKSAGQKLNIISSAL